MGLIKINGNDKEMTNLSLEQVSEDVKDEETPNPEFKLDTSLLETSEKSKPRIIKNL